MRYQAACSVLATVSFMIAGCGDELQPVEVQENFELHPQALADDEAFETQMRTEVLPSGEYKLNPKPEVVHE